MVLREKRGSQLIGFLLIVAGAVVLAFAISVRSDHPESEWAAGALFGLIFAGIGWKQLTMRECLEFNPALREVVEWRKGLVSYKATRIGIERFASAGTEALRDPRTGKIWWSETRLRRKDGTHLAIDSGIDVEAFARLAGLPVENSLKDEIQPIIATGS